MKQHNYLWMDLETTGLIPERGKILEWAAVLADDVRGGSFEIVQSFHTPVFYADVDAEVIPLCDDFVRKMHTNNGLFDAIRNQLTCQPLNEIEDFLIDLVGGPDTKQIEIAGNSVHFDHRWIEVHMPRFAKTLSHRVFNVSTLISADRDWGRAIEQKSAAHRALPDVKMSLATAKRMHDAYFLGK